MVTNTQRVLEQAVESYREEYRELAQDWHALDTKAQGSIAVAGIFLAGTFAFIRNLTATDATGFLVLLVVTVIALLAAVLFGILALRIREVLVPPLGEQYKTLVDDLARAGDLDTNDDRFTNFLNDECGRWHEAGARATSTSAVASACATPPG